jgi:acyl carrier protein
VADQLCVDKTNLDREVSFFELGVDSLMSRIICDTLETALKLEISTNMIFNYNTVDTLSRKLFETKVKLKSSCNDPSINSKDKSLTKVLPGETDPEENYKHCTEEELIHLLEKELR